MNTKTWVISFIVGIMLLMGAFMAVNYGVDSIGYFAVEHNKNRWEANSYFKASKFKQIKKNHNQYTGFVLGGSKSGTVDPQRLEVFTGDKWFNLCINSPTFQEYYRYVDWLSKNTDVKKICLYLSGHEINRKWAEEPQSSTRKLPEATFGDDLDALLEKLYHLTLDVESNIQYLDVNEEYKDIYYYKANTGDIDYLAYKKAIQSEDESKDWIKEHVLQEYQNNLDILFKNSTKTIISAEENLKALRRIKNICRNKNIDLMVILGPTFIGELSLYESQGFYEYLRCLVNEITIWNFSGINSINLNPYNFIDNTHCNNDVNNLVIDIVYGGKEDEDIGLQLTNENIDDYIGQRKACFARLEKEYDATGTVELIDSWEQRIH